ncbi:hypothetical protein J437_LFUL008144 [Ladona fulva]|uniref:Glucose-methanol-choline oxidoreductase N-terminal domain-containing protein n=1 Tax=Ladona fulva TaxID=123851 RepID=A0A8K0JUP5_LADFU|nr:hypothetical protein J437_LFUL008144 [Ladona fulva]
MLSKRVNNSFRLQMAGCDCAVPASSGPSLAATCGGAPAMLFMGLLEVFLRSQCDLEDPCGRPSTRKAADPSPYDFIVVGGGSAGAAVAARLSEIPYWRVLLIEAGGDEPTATQVPSMFLNWFGTDIDWNFKTEPQEMACLSNPERRCGWPRGKVLGGTSVINGMMKEIVLSGGAVNSPQILLLSGVGPQEDLEKIGIPVIQHLPGVGMNLQNHVAFFVNFFVNESATTSLNWATAMEYLLFRDGLMSGTGVSATTAFVHSRLSEDPKGDDPDLQYFFGGYLANCAKTGQVGEREDPNAPADAMRSVQFIPAVIHPKSRGYLKLKSADPAAYPLIQPLYLTHPEDVERLVDGVKIAIKLSKTDALKPFGLQLDTTPAPGCENYEFGSDEYWRCAVRSQTGAENHQAGSCKMGKDPLNGAVVDSELRVHGVAGLRVMDASVMPTVTSGNTHAPSVMIAEKGSDHIKATWLGRRLWTVWTH